MKTIFHNASQKIMSEDQKAQRFASEMQYSGRIDHASDDTYKIKLPDGKQIKMPVLEFTEMKRPLASAFGNSSRNSYFSLYHHLRDKRII